MLFWKLRNLSPVNTAPLTSKLSPTLPFILATPTSPLVSIRDKKHIVLHAEYRQGQQSLCKSKSTVSSYPSTMKSHFSTRYACSHIRSCPSILGTLNILKSLSGMFPFWLSIKYVGHVVTGGVSKAPHGSMCLLLLFSARSGECVLYFLKHSTGIWRLNFLYIWT